MVDRITGFGGAVPPNEYGRIPNVNYGYDHFIRNLLRNNLAVGPPEDITDFSYNRPEYRKRGFWDNLKGMWDSAPNWVKWTGAAMLAIVGMRFLGGRGARGAAQQGAFDMSAWLNWRPFR